MWKQWGVNALDSRQSSVVGDDHRGIMEHQDRHQEEDWVKALLYRGRAGISLYAGEALVLRELNCMRARRPRYVNCPPDGRGAHTPYACPRMPDLKRGYLARTLCPVQVACAPSHGASGVLGGCPRWGRGVLSVPSALSTAGFWCVGGHPRWGVEPDTRRIGRSCNCIAWMGWCPVRCELSPVHSLRGGPAVSSPR